MLIVALKPWKSVITLHTTFPNHSDIHKNTSKERGELLLHYKITYIVTIETKIDSLGEKIL